MAENPPDGVHIDYVLNRPPAGPVVLSILDAQGNLVRRYSSADAPAKADLSRIRTTPDWVPPPAAPSATPGMHRFAWPLRYPAPREKDDWTPYADGAWAPPGRYTVEL